MTASARKPLAVVTGASSGIGFELAKQFAEHDYDLVLAAEDEAVNDAARRLGEAVTEVVRVDLATFEGVEQLADRVEATRREVAALVINAGVGVGGEFAGDTRLSDHLRVVDLNVRSAVHLAKRLTPAMAAQRHGRVLFTSSVAAAAPGPYLSVYAASKAFISSFSEALRHELRPAGVTVTALLPGPTDTEFFERAGMEDTKIAAGDKDDPAVVAGEGFQAMMAGEGKVVAGSASNTVQSVGSRVLTDEAKARLQAKMAEPGSADR